MVFTESFDVILGDLCGVEDDGDDDDDDNDATSKFIGIPM